MSELDFLTQLLSWLLLLYYKNYRWNLTDPYSLKWWKAENDDRFEATYFDIEVSDRSKHNV